MSYTVGIIIEGTDDGYIHKASNLLGIIELLADHINSTSGDVVVIPQLSGKYGKSTPNYREQIDIAERFE